ncbi:putative protein [Giant panda circovirus 2]|uniref:Uncharacterized protein n=1 Tax=Giant panda circovirus 2 TaxID=2016457 RepID=A0A220IGR3_9CIRC|nr:putative protein [Giant panda circovirus 2]ASH99184.1 putative protein [Giant panda circovirus 2]
MDICLHCKRSPLHWRWTICSMVENQLPQQDSDICRAILSSLRDADSTLCERCFLEHTLNVRKALTNKTMTIAQRTETLKNLVNSPPTKEASVPVFGNLTENGASPWTTSPLIWKSLNPFPLCTEDIAVRADLSQTFTALAQQSESESSETGSQSSSSASKMSPTIEQLNSSSTSLEESVSLGSADTYSAN